MEAEMLPLFPDLPPSRPVFRSMDRVLFDDPFLAELVETPALLRLKCIGFLGAMDYVCFGNGSASHRRRHNRFDHSVGVAKLALLFAEIRELPLDEKRVLAAAGLLHDVGHGPLSHTLEPVFKREFDITHHHAGTNILYGQSAIGNLIPTIMKKYGVDLDEVNAMIEGVHDGPHAFLFSSPMNLDTIEGMTRCRSFFSASHTISPARKIVEEMALSNSFPTETLDTFWLLKNEIYNVFIHSSIGHVFDGLAQAYMAHEIDRFEPEDFLRTEGELRRREPSLFYLFSWFKKSSQRVRFRLPDAMFEYETSTPTRSFAIDTKVDLASSRDLSNRYRQTKTFRDISLSELLETEAV